MTQVGGDPTGRVAKSAVRLSAALVARLSGAAPTRARIAARVGAKPFQIRSRPAFGREMPVPIFRRSRPAAILEIG